MVKPETPRGCRADANFAARIRGKSPSKADGKCAALRLILQRIGGHFEPYVRQSGPEIGDHPPTACAAWLLIGQIATTVGLTVREQAAMAMW